MVRSRSRWPAISCLLLALFCVVPGGGTRAETVEIDGRPGFDGRDGDGLRRPFDGWFGQPLERTVGPGDPENRVELRAGDGGDGGDQGTSSRPAGNGGAGGSAVAAARTEADDAPADLTAFAYAEGGDGGLGGAASPGSPEAAGVGGPAGEAHASAEVVGGVPGTRATATARASGGAGGAAGSSGVPGLGDDGLRGGDARADSRLIAVEGIARGVASATGGRGGVGVGLGARGGDGGAASASLELITRGGYSVGATVRGGRGGDGREGADAGDGAAVEFHDAFASVDSTGEGRGALGLSATGGDGGDASGAPGIASGDAGEGGRARIATDLSTPFRGALDVNLDAIGGSGGDAEEGGRRGAGGSASVDAALATAGSLSVDVLARGGAPGLGRSRSSQDSAGADAEVRVSGVSTGEGATVRMDVAVAGALGGAGDGADAQAASGGSASGSAHGESTSTGIAEIELAVFGGRGGDGRRGADAGDGADVDLVDAVSGRGGRVVLRQRAFGGDAGNRTGGGSQDAAPGRGGSASSILSASNPDGDLRVEVLAAGGDAEWSADAAGSTHASAIARARDDAEAIAELRGATGAAPGGVTVGPVHATSTGGGRARAEVSVRGASSADIDPSLGDGGSVRLVDAVTAESTGQVELIQTARAGNGRAPISPGVAGGLGGDAHSEIARHVRADRLLVELRATGGDSAGRASTGDGQGGGSASVRADLSNAVGGIFVGYLAEGGVSSTAVPSGASAGRGGRADATIEARATGDADSLRIIPFGGARGGDGGQGSTAGPTSARATGGDGGAAETTLRGVHEGAGPVEVSGISWGGDGADAPSTGGAGGIARVDAHGRNAGSAPVQVSARATGGDGGSGMQQSGAGGRAVARALGESSGGGNVEVLAIATGGDAGPGGRGADVTLIDAARGRTAGGITLRQEAIAGDGGMASGGRAVSEITHRDDDGGPVDVVSRAAGGEGGGDARAAALVSGMESVSVEVHAEGGEDGGEARASAWGSGGEAVSVEVHAQGGRGAPGGGDGGVGSVGASTGFTTGFEPVTVAAEARGGTGGSGFVSTTGNEGNAGAGGDAFLIDVVEGGGLGYVALNQRAIGGDAGTAAAGGARARGGSAVNRLERAFAAGNLVLGALATAGAGSEARSSGGSYEAGGRGGDATILYRVKNASGRIEVRPSAIAGVGGLGSDGSSRGDGGEARVHVEATSRADGASVTIGRSGSGAVGGGSQSGSETDGSPGGRGGRAVGTSIGRAFGREANVFVRQRSAGGGGAVGGAAHAVARGLATGGGRVEVEADARGGRSSVGRRGAATAEAFGESIGGSVRAEAEASEFVPIGTFQDAASGDLRAVAEATGHSVEAEARAIGRTGRIGGASYSTRVIARGIAQPSTPSIGQGPDPTPSSLAGPEVETFHGPEVGIVGLPEAGLRLSGEARKSTRGVRSIFESKTAAAAAVSTAHDRQDEIARVGFALAAPDGTGPIDLDIVLRTEVSLGLPTQTTGVDGLFISFLEIDLDPKAGDSGFESVAFRVEDGGAALVDVRLTTAEAIRSFFSTPIALNDAMRPPDDDLFPPRPRPGGLRFVLEGTGARGGRLGVAFALGTAVVPEPGTALLVGLGLVVLACRRDLAGAVGD